MAWLFPHAAGPLLIRYKAGHWLAELRGKRLGSWPSPDSAASALHTGTTSDPAWNARDDRILVPAETTAWRPTYDAWEDRPPAAFRQRRSRVVTPTARRTSPGDHAGPRPEAQRRT
jgi:hypothetical protein